MPVIKSISVTNSVRSFPQKYASLKHHSPSSKVVSDSPKTETLIVDEERCCYRDCNRRRFKDKDRIHPFCGKYHASLYQKESRGMQRRTDLNLKLCVLYFGVDLEVATEELCKTPGCANFKYRDQSGRTFDYCSKYCRDNQPKEGEYTNLKTLM